MRCYWPGLEAFIEQIGNCRMCGAISTGYPLSDRRQSHCRSERNQKSVTT